MNLTGQRFGRLTAISHFKKIKPNGIGTETHWVCRCDCGEYKTVWAGNLRKGNSKSCGCLHREASRDRRLKHGHSRSIKSKEYRTWAQIKSRCTNPHRKDWQYYGGRGIQMCDRWITSFENFFQDVGPAPSAKHTIDRIQANGNYEPGNVRWATHKEQMNNFSRNRLLTHNGQTKTLSQWAEEKNLSSKVLGDRINKCGWDLDRALNTPVRKK